MRAPINYGEPSEYYKRQIGKISVCTYKCKSVFMTHYSISVCDYMLYSHREGSIHYLILSNLHTVHGRRSIKVEEIRFELNIVVN